MRQEADGGAGALSVAPRCRGAVGAGLPCGRNGVVAIASSTISANAAASGIGVAGS